jgi:transcriptional regulator with XRE-family HTH domain
MSVAQHLRDARKRAGLTLEQLSEAAKVSKTYLWELENDEDGSKKPSADILLKIAEALSVTIGDLIGLPSLQVDKSRVVLPPSLIEFRDMMAKQMKQPVSEQDLHDLATMRFRGGQPRTKESWYQLYLTLKHTTDQK